MIVEGQKAIEYIPAGQTEMLPLGTDWQSRHTEAERRKAEIRGRIHKQTDHYQKTAKDYFRPAKPTLVLPAKSRFLQLKIKLSITLKRLQKPRTGHCRIYTVMKENPVHH